MQGITLLWSVLNEVALLNKATDTNPAMSPGQRVQCVERFSFTNQYQK